MYLDLGFGACQSIEVGGPIRGSRAESQKERAAKAAEKQVRLQQQALRARQTAVPLARPSTAGELERLAGLRASGALTDAEFAAAKAKILGA